MRTAYIAAMPRELAAIVKGGRAGEWAETRPSSFVRMYRSDLAMAACAGIGKVAVTRAFAAVAELEGVERIVSVGLAGACDPALQAGEVRRCSVVIDVRSGERFSSAEAEPGSVTLATGAVVASAEEKARLFASYGAAMVDMEAATVARLAQARGLAFLAIKAVSDTASAALPDMSNFISDDGQFSEARFAAHVAVRPALWRVAVALGRDSSKALRALTQAVQDDIAAHAR